MPLFKLQTTLTLFLLLCLHSFGQNDGILLEKSRVESGMITPFTTAIFSDEYAFSGTIEQVHIDTATNTAIIHLGELKSVIKKLIVFDLKKEEVIWKIDYNLSDATFTYIDSFLLIKSSKNQSMTKISLRTGETIWENPYEDKYVDQKRNIALCYKMSDLQFGQRRAMHCIDLKTGKSLWWRDIEIKEQWHQLLPLNDSIVIINSNGLHSINLNNGNGWQYELDIESTTKMAIPPPVYYAVSAIRFVYIPKKITVDVTGVVSNLLNIGDRLYVAAASSLHCINTSNAELIWIAPLNNKLTSQSRLSLLDGNLILYNTGQALHNNEHLNAGKPSFSSFDATTGQQHFSVVLSHKTPFMDVHSDTVNHRTCFIYDDRVICYSKKTGRIEGSRIFDRFEYEPLSMFIGVNLFEMNPDKVGVFQPIEPKGIVVLTSKLRIIEMNYQMNELRMLEPKEIYIAFHQNSNYNIIQAEDYCILTDKDNRGLALLNISNDSFFAGDILYDYFENKFNKIDLSRK